MRATMKQDGLIHRQAMSGRGRAQCGATAPEHGYLNLSMHGVRVTCPRCQPQESPSIVSLSCPRCGDHGWSALTHAEIASASTTCAACHHTAPVRDFIG